MIDRDDACSTRFGGRTKHARYAVDRHGSSISRVNAGKDLHQRALARAVGSHQRVDLATDKIQRRRLERYDCAESLSDVSDLKKRRGVVHRNGSTSARSQFVTARTIATNKCD